MLNPITSFIEKETEAHRREVIMTPPEVDLDTGWAVSFPPLCPMFPTLDSSFLGIWILSPSLRPL